MVDSNLFSTSAVAQASVSISSVEHDQDEDHAKQIKNRNKHHLVLLLSLSFSPCYSSSCSPCYHLFSPDPEQVARHTALMLPYRHILYSVRCPISMSITGSILETCKTIVRGSFGSWTQGWKMIMSVIYSINVKVNQSSSDR